MTIAKNAHRIRSFYARELIYDWHRAGYTIADIAEGIWQWYGYANAHSCHGSLLRLFGEDKVSTMERIAT